MTKLQLVKISKSNLLQNPPILFVMIMDWPVHLKHQELLPKGVHIKQACQAFFCLPRKSPIKIGSPVRVIKKMDQLLALNQYQKPLTNRRNHSKETRFQTIKYEMVEFHQAPDQSINSIILVWFLFLHSILMLLQRFQMKTKINTSLVKSKSITIAISSSSSS